MIGDRSWGCRGERARRAGATPKRGACGGKSGPFDRDVIGVICILRGGLSGPRGPRGGGRGGAAGKGYGERSAPDAPPRLALL